MRSLWVILHRYLGLFMALFLLQAGLTGSIMAFDDEIDAWLNPQLFTAPGRGPPLSAQHLINAIESSDARLNVTYVPLGSTAGQAVKVGVRARPGMSSSTGGLGFNQLFADPVTGDILGTRQIGALRFDRAHFIPAIIQLHYSLFMPGKWGYWLLGGVALLWTVDCFIGLYLTLPRGRPFMEKWRPAWQIKRKRFNFDLHRAGGLWAWIVLLILAISSVSLNLYSEVFKPVVSWFSPITPTPFDSRRVNPSPGRAMFDYDEAVHRASEAAKLMGIDKPIASIGHRPERGFYFAMFQDADQLRAIGLSARLYLDDRTGAVIGSRGAGRDSAGDLFAQLQYPLHSGRIAGVWGRTLICVVGLLVAALSVTGIIIWWRKRRARLLSTVRHTAVSRHDRDDRISEVVVASPASYQRHRA